MVRRMAEPEKCIRSEVRENLEARCANCSECEGEGVVTIFHDKYTPQQPSILIRRRNGRVKHYALVCAVPCICPLGFWIRQARDAEEATASRHATIDYQKVIEGRVPWSKKDPSLPYIDPGEVIEPGDFARLFEDLTRDVKTSTDHVAVDREQRRKQKERWFLQFLVHFLRQGPMAFSGILEMAGHAGRHDPSALRKAADTLGVIVETCSVGELWILPEE